jgi:hypothetical protein
MYSQDPFKIGPAQPLTDAQKAKRQFDIQWDAIGKSTLEERIEKRNRVLGERLKRAFSEDK